MTNILRSITVAIVTLLCSQAVAQSWHKLRIPIIAAESQINSALFTSPDTSFFAGSYGAFVRTNDRGKTWEWVLTGLKCDECQKHFSRLEEFSGKLSLTVQYQGLVNERFRLTSSDGGLTWDSIEAQSKTIPLTSQRVISAIKQLIEDSLWAIVISESDDDLRYTLSLHVSTDRGSTWVRRSTVAEHVNGYSGQPPSDALDAFVALDPNHLIVYANNTVEGARRHVSSDHGFTWIESKDSGQLDEAYKIEPDRLFGQAAGYKYVISADQGESWERISTPAFPLNSIKAVSSHRSGLVYAYSDIDSLQGLLFESRDYGDNWTRYQLTTERILEPVTIVDSSLAFAFASDAVYTNLPETARIQAANTINALEVSDGQLHLPGRGTEALAVFDHLGRRYTLHASQSNPAYFLLSLPHGVYFVPELGKFAW